jgi:hypothetical protein
MRLAAMSRRFAPVAPALGMRLAMAPSTLVTRRNYAVPREETVQRVLTVVRAFDKVSAFR